MTSAKLLKRKFVDKYPDDECWDDISSYGEELKRFWIKRCLSMTKKQMREELE